MAALWLLLDADHELNCAAGIALLAGTGGTQRFERKDTGCVPIPPCETDGIVPDELSSDNFLARRWRGDKAQRVAVGRLLAALFPAGGTGAVHTQPSQLEPAAVAVLPDDVHAATAPFDRNITGACLDGHRPIPLR